PATAPASKPSADQSSEKHKAIPHWLAPHCPIRSTLPPRAAARSARSSELPTTSLHSPTTLPPAPLRDGSSVPAARLPWRLTVHHADAEPARCNRPNHPAPPPAASAPAAIQARPTSWPNPSSA